MFQRRPHHRITVSVVIPVKDDAAHLDRCLRSIARQSLAVDEVVVVDNGSGDDSADVARRHGARVVSCAHPGVAAAASAGYDAALGHVILRLDADSAPGPGWARTMTEALHEEQNVGAVFGGASFHDGGFAARSRAPI